ncbi:PD-(D/E)XK nuclease family protein [Jannaschia sp. W003]|uniref:PDDEXK-like family protein n=1 Tax=Jannaschia sp. W003 TaxID=2867012 RepID=UPI0021A64EE0|nr:PD-(D/E)XK nuclease family protein [Jannaschia sp. W003]UWQ22341.1 PD-(D/E)XK nuclease family protein [Jannaschia sp. W003]
MNDLAFIDDLKTALPRLDAERAGEVLFGAPHLSMFDVLGDSEMQLSRTFAMLLDPRGAHGQGPLFLNAFLRRLGLRERKRSEACTVRTEHTTAYGRIDILLEMPDATVVIENKPWSGLGHRQLERYAEFLATIRGKGTRLVFLSQWDVEDGGEALGHYVHMPFVGSEHSFAECLEGAIPAVKAYRAEVLVRDVVDHLERRFGGRTRSMDPLQGEIRSRLDDDPSAARIVTAIVADQNHVRDWMTDRLGQAIIEALPQGYEILEQKRNLTRRRIDRSAFRLSEFGWEMYSCLMFRNPRWPANCSIGFSPDATGRRSVVVGINAPQASKGAPCDARDEIDGLLVAAEIDVKTVEHWPAWDYAEPRDWDGQQLANFFHKTDCAPLTNTRFAEMLEYLQSLASILDAKYDPPAPKEVAPHA